MLLEVSADSFSAAAKQLASERHTWVSPSTAPTSDPRTRRIELSVGDATCQLEAAEIREIFACLLAASRG
jgi:hypothetical protein